MITPRVLLKGKFKAEAINISHVQSRRRIHPQYELLAKQAWEIALTEAKALGKKAWDSEQYRLEKLVLTDEGVVT